MPITLTTYQFINECFTRFWLPLAANPPSADALSRRPAGFATVYRASGGLSFVLFGHISRSRGRRKVYKVAQVLFHIASRGLATYILKTRTFIFRLFHMAFKSPDRIWAWWGDRRPSKRSQAVAIGFN